jgi:hypothetical protein
MYRKNVAGQYIYFVLVKASDGTALTGATVTAYRALDNGSQASATGTTTELANGQYRFNLSQADTNADYGSYLFTAATAVPVEKTVVFTAANPTDADAFGLSKFADIETDTQDIQSRLPAALVSGRIDSSVGAMAANTLTASALASDAVAEIQSGSLDAAGVRAAVGLASANLDTQLSGINAKTQLITTGTVFVTVDRVAGSTITMHYNESTTATVPLDEDATSLTLRFIVENSDQLDVLVIENASITRTASNFTVTITTAVTATLGQYRWALRDITGGVNRHIEGGVLQVISAANKDA